MTRLPLPHHHSQHMELLSERLPAAEDCLLLADLFKQLGDPTRIRIFWLLCHCEECVTNISSLMQMSSPAVSHHLRLLKDSHLILSRREGKEVYYRGSDTEQAYLLHEMIEQMMAIACPLPDKLCSGREAADSVSE